MRTFLFSWNPDDCPWESLEDDVKELDFKGALSHMWNCKSHKLAKIGDRAFFIKLGKKTKVKGLIGAGYISSESFLAEHYDGSGRLVPRVMIDFEDLVNRNEEPIILMKSLKSGSLSNYFWSIIASGTEIKPDIAKELERIWFEKTQNHLTKNKLTTKKYFEANPYNLQITKYERNPYARQACLEHYGYTCMVCKTNFEEKYGEIGIDFIHVHHLNPISTSEKEIEVNPIKDLRPVCPNCHSMIHKRKKPFTIEEMIEKYKH